ncbi:hypothetical protein AQUCO_00300717v1, partial [Aquilegia coerulea]
MFDENNALVKVFRSARDRYAESPAVDMRIRLIGTRNRDAREYNLPSSNEVAALIIGNDGETLDHRDITVEKIARGLRRITELHPSYMAMQYPILFPYGEDGFRTKILYNGLVVARGRGRSTVSIREYYAFRIQQRENEGHTLIMVGRLFQQFLVDAYTSIEEERLRYVWKNHKLIRSDLYQGLRDAAIRDDNAASVVGKRVVFPATFTGGPRYMAGSPDLFITVMCNPKWSEITEAMSLIPGQKHDDRPDIVSRMFKIKLDLLLDDLCIHKHFGKVNKIISAELPNKELDPLAYDSVLEFMIHGPCGKDKDKFPCMEKGRCSKHFPKKFTNDTVKDPDGFYTHRRRNNGRTGIKNDIEIDNRSVVPHNLDLIVKYQCHINVEVCNRGRAVKYLFMYIHKGKDRATIVIERNDEKDNCDGETSVRIIDEIKTYLDCRYISASEASWRIFGFNTQFREPTVERLPFHLEDEQQVTYRDGDNTTEVLERPSTTKTKFLQWMEINKKFPDDPNARDLTYAEFPTKWRWVEENLEWVPRKKGRVRGRIYYAYPTSGERHMVPNSSICVSRNYYLCILLNHVKGPRDYKDLKTYNNETYDTFKEACMARGLLDDDGEWDAELKYAGTWSSKPDLQMSIEDIKNVALIEIELLLMETSI